MYSVEGSSQGRGKTGKIVRGGYLGHVLDNVFTRINTILTFLSGLERESWVNASNSSCPEHFVQDEGVMRLVSPR